MPSNADSALSSNGPHASVRIPVVAIVGPTAVGKTALAIALGERFDCELIGADSRQIYRFMDIGTAKPTAAERARIPYHLIDLVTPDETLTLMQYKQLANDCIQSIHARGELPLLVGGTGLYVKAVLEGWTIPEVAPDYTLRAELEREAQLHGIDHLYRRLQQADPVAALKVDPRNVRRVIRYLEVYQVAGEPISSRQSKQPPPFDILQIGLTLPRDQLYSRIDARVDAMMRAGLLDEVRELLARGYDEDLPSLSGFGYRQMIEHLRGRMSLEQAVYETKKETRRFVRKQYAWFPLGDHSILWLNADESSLERASDAIRQFKDSIHVG